MRLIPSGKIDTALDGHEIVEVILILKFSRQHQPQRSHEKPEFRIALAKADECVWIRRSILCLRERESMDKHFEGYDIKSFEK